MTTLYRPVLIETAEQAEALPEGTIIIHAENYPQEKFAGLWGRAGNSSQQLADEEGWSALVPIEAEKEETVPIELFGGTTHMPRPSDSHPGPRTRLVTPWTPTEEA